jgi:hypothetical protein
VKLPVLLVGIRNTGAPSIAGQWKLIVVIPNQPAVEGRIQHYLGSFITTDGKGEAYELDASNLLDEKVVETPIATGAEQKGILLFTFKGISGDQMAVAGTTFRLSFRDVLGKEGAVEYRWDGTPGNERPRYEPGITMKPIDKEEMMKKLKRKR